MSSVGEAYILAEHIHDTFFGVNGILSEEELAHSGVNATIGSTSSPKVRRLETEGIVEDRHAKQTLSKDRLGTFHLSTTFMEVGGEHVQSDIRIESEPADLDVVFSTLFMKRLIDFGLNR
jgi:hypothetical protein